MLNSSRPFDPSLDHLAKDSSGQVLRSMVSQIKNEVRRVDQIMRNGLDRQQFAEANKYLAALGAAEKVITKVWRRRHHNNLGRPS